ncbi:uncharacterized protein [Paramormyrops kingsleyae]|uniref:uncharacterized protein isoform X2 n=1 Tax=Paramormyrops kingsleyae TaxID=1676925 RepID=UPI000CD5FC55|nr:uncharacterized protein LOC111838903 isoform X2 [Paramormyrops kingsleyae]XP_023658109.1 uncharacterized protein LOC111838903 isoform X2 [Paramormyrops kingsleyae]XP_023658110.1 uncharacterized protein LOC111838903 isoform X2 [Paramormyrops kingsleyae]
MLDPGTPDCYMEPNGSQVESSSLETEDLSFEGAHLQANGKPDLSFGEWNSFGEGIQLDVSDYWSISAASTPPECLQVEEYDGANQQSSWSIRKAINWSELQKTFECCFPALESTLEEAVAGSIRPLSHLMESATEVPTSSSAVTGAAPLWQCLLTESQSPKLSAPSLHPHSQGSLLAALNITMPAVALQQDGTPAALDPEEGDMESLDPNSTLTLIQTKLLPPPQCRDGPGFIYQISHQWFSQYSLRLQGQESRKGFFL